MKTGLIMILFVIVSSCLHSQSLNKLNKRGERTGRWEIYSDSLKLNATFKGQYRRGKQVGACYFYNEGTLYRKEICRFNRMNTTLYYPSGRIFSKGKARQVSER